MTVLKRSATFPDEPAFAPVDDLAVLGERARRRLWHLLARQCEAMVQHALKRGHTIPIEVIELLDHAFSSLGTQATLSTASDRDESKARASPPDVPALVALFRAHEALAAIIAPATPEAVLLFSDERIRHPVMITFGPVPIAREMLGLALVSLIALLGVSLFPDINNANMSKSLLNLSGAPLFLVEIFLLSAASLGSCFANLQRINRFVSDGTFDPKYRSTYWMRWVMGVISGIVLSQLVYRVFVESSSAPTGGGTMPGVIGQPLLALLGGYSVDVVHTILNRIINAISSVFRGPEDGSSGSQRSLADANRSIQDRLNAVTPITAGPPVNAIPAMSGRSQSPSRPGEQDIPP